MRALGGEEVKHKIVINHGFLSWQTFDILSTEYIQLFRV